MKRFLAVLLPGAVIALLVSGGVALSAQRIRDFPTLYQTLNGSPSFLGVIAGTSSSVNNHTTGTAFRNTGEALTGKTLLLQSDATCHILPGTTNAAAATVANGVKLAADERVILTMTREEGWLAAIAPSTTCNVRVWELR